MLQLVVRGSKVYLWLHYKRVLHWYNLQLLARNNTKIWGVLKSIISNIRAWYIWHARTYVHTHRHTFCSMMWRFLIIITHCYDNKLLPIKQNLTKSYTNNHLVLVGYNNSLATSQVVSHTEPVSSFSDRWWWLLQGWREQQSRQLTTPLPTESYCYFYLFVVKW